jgi:aspartyl-tRNA(Asn)/glutamyl-tRNA(Gln) amidotransferase subunit B
MFCSCKNDPDEDKPNINICPVCMGHPGTLPVLNIEAIKHVVRIGTAVGGKIADFTEWDRKNYFYPDIPKGYQISQYKYPLVTGGEIANVALTRIHLEEDTAQSTHDTHEHSLINFNRAGVPLMELVTEPVIHDATTAVRFAKELQLLLRYLGAGEANMEKGEMRVEANISIATEEDTKAKKFGTKTEVKNLNSFRAVERAIAFEVDRQTKLLDKGEKIAQETRGWDENAGKTFSQRAKESAHDYRYFPDPDLPKLKISEIKELDQGAIRSTLPELPSQKRERYILAYKMTAKEVAVFVDSIEVSKYFESVISKFNGDEKKIRLSINYILSDYLGLLKKDYGESPEGGINKISNDSFASLIELVSSSKVNSRGAKDVLASLYVKDGDPLKLAEEKGLIQNLDEGAILKIVSKVVTENPTVIADYKGGKSVAMQFLIGKAMKETKGAANPDILKKLFIDTISFPQNTDK